MVPCILIDPDRFTVCFYDCTNDLLLISEPKQLQSMNNTMSRSVALLMWLTINHRKYVRKLKNVDAYKSTIVSRLGDKLDCFKHLSDKNLEWNSSNDSKRITPPTEGPFQSVSM